MPLRYQFLLTAALTLVIKGAVFLFGGFIAWWLAAVIAVVVVFGGCLLADALFDGVGDDDYSSDGDAFDVGDSWWD